MKKSKKRWTWTEKQVRKARTKYWRETAPTWYCKMTNKEHKTESKKSLHKVMLGYDVDFLEYGRTNHRHSATWMWF